VLTRTGGEMGCSKFLEWLAWRARWFRSKRHSYSGWNPIIVEENSMADTSKLHNAATAGTGSGGGSSSGDGGSSSGQDDPVALSRMIRRSVLITVV